MARARRGNKRPYHRGHVPLDVSRLGGITWQESDDSGRTYAVRSLRGGAKNYRCPGCLQIVEAGSPHVVAWVSAADSSGQPWHSAGEGVDGRRHWHRSCFAARNRRR